MYKVCAENENYKQKWTKLRKCEGSVVNNKFLTWLGKCREKCLSVLGTSAYRRRLSKSSKFMDWTTCKFQTGGWKSSGKGIRSRLNRSVGHHQPLREIIRHNHRTGHLQYQWAFFFSSTQQDQDVQKWKMQWRKSFFFSERDQTSQIRITSSREVFGCCKGRSSREREFIFDYTHWTWTTDDTQ